MSIFKSTAKPTGSPWGAVQHATECGAGIWFVSTPSHGGFIISEERRLAMPEALRAPRAFGDAWSFEEDCECALVIVAFPQEFSTDQVHAAGDVVRGMAGAVTLSLHRHAQWKAAADYIEGCDRLAGELAGVRT